MNFFKVVIPSKNVYIKVLRHSLKTFLSINGIKEENVVYMIELAVNEAVANIIEHTYNYEEDKIIEAEFIWENKKIIIKLRDFGQKINPDNIKHRPLEEYRDGGLGVFIIEQVFGKPKWIDVEEGNLLYLEKDL